MCHPRTIWHLEFLDRNWSLAILLLLLRFWRMGTLAAGSMIWDDQFGGCRAQRYQFNDKVFLIISMGVVRCGLLFFPTSNPQHRRKLRNLQSWWRISWSWLFWLLISYMVEEVLLNLLSNMFDVFYGPKEIWCDGHEPKLVAPDDATTNLISWSKTDSNQESEFANILLQSQLSCRVWVKRPCLMCWRCATETTGSTRDGQVLWVAKGCLEWKLSSGQDMAEKKETLKDHDLKGSI